MSVDLGALREGIKPHQQELLVKKTNKPTDDAEILELMISNQFEKDTVIKTRRVGRPNKKENQLLKSRLTLILTEEQKQIIDKRRGANTIGEIDVSSFVREWLIKTDCFNTTINPIKDNPSTNLPE